ncbi:probable oligoribonuclease [Plodia interpunctella]|uniref:probable oligoribonuclease n=1 Tax=Plodia interpunctella TaxID=58824 RepID=UPI00236880A4|nr:probable oligoribonuclease [Plodia interpunctella]
MNSLRKLLFTKIHKPPFCLYSTHGNVPAQQIDMSLRTAKNMAKRIVWVDLEMTGLNVETDRILEIACLVTDADLNIVATGPNLVIHQPNSVLENMNQWCINQHGESGLTEASRNSKITLEEAENQILSFVQQHVPEKRCPIGGNSIYMDRLFLRKYMPKFNDYLHYRVIDVSTVKELAKRWYQKDFSSIPQKSFKHRTIDDIHDSIKELKYYKEHIFKSNPN